MPADLRYAARLLLRSPGFTSIAILCLALGIGSNTAIFTLVNTVLLRTLPVREPSRLVLLTLSQPDRFTENAIPSASYEYLRDHNDVLEGLVGISGLLPVVVVSGTAERLRGLAVTDNFFATLGVNAIVGRMIGKGDADACVLNYDFWRRRFGADPGVIGSKLLLDTHLLTIAGVAPKGFTGLDQNLPVDIYALSRGPVRLSCVGRLKPGVSASRAQAQLDVLYHQVARGRNEKLSDNRVILVAAGRGTGRFVKQYQRPLLMLMIVVGIVLLIACANVSNLLMARASRRSRETAVRLALGAGRGRLLRQFIAESMLLAVAGSLAGIVLAYEADRILARLAPRVMGWGALVLDVSPDVKVLAFTLAAAVLVTLLTGTAPAVSSAGPNLVSALKGETGLRAPGRLSFANILVVAQVALSLILLIAAGLFLRSLGNLRSVDAGFNPEGLVLLTVATDEPNFFDSLIERVRRLPGVVSASAALISPLSSSFSMTGITVPGYQPQPGEQPLISINLVGPGYFKTMQTPLLAGRMFDEQEARDRKVAVINEPAARHYWPHESPIGKHVWIGGRDREEREIIGVVKGIKTESLRAEAEPAIYSPFAQRPRNRNHLCLHVRVAGPAAPVVDAMVRQVRALDPAVPMEDINTMEAQIDNTIALDRLLAALTGLFGGLAVLLALAGLYGVMAFTVAARTREIGIRLALGATEARVLRQVLRESVLLILLGIAIGLPVSLWASRVTQAFLYGLRSSDALTYGVSSALLAAAAFMAAWAPAHRAAEVDPAVALKYE